MNKRNKNHLIVFFVTIVTSPIRISHHRITIHKNRTPRPNTFHRLNPSQSRWWAIPTAARHPSSMQPPEDMNTPVTTVE